jgi:hypothetical protein
MKSKPNRRIVVSFQDFNGSTPTTLLATYEADSEMKMIKVFDWAWQRLREEKFPKQIKEHLHD